MRILIITPSSPLKEGGVERHVLEVSRRLAGAGADVEVLCSDPGGPAITEEYRDGVRIRVVRAWPAGRDWRFAPRIWREVARGRWDVVHVQSYHTLVAPLGMLRALWLGIPYVVSFHGGGHSSFLRRRLRGVQRRMLRPLLRRAARLVAVARFEIEQYGRELGVPAERFVLIPNGTSIRTSPWQAGAGTGVDPDEEVVLASIGRLERYKGHHRAIAALPGVIAVRPRARLLIVGTGPYEARLRRQAAELDIDGRVEFTSVPAGDADGMCDLLERVDLVVLLSDFETHPLTGLEAAGARRRLIVPGHSGLLELARAGLARAIAPDSPPHVVARAILEELDRPPPAFAPILPSWDDCAEGLLDLYRAVAGGSIIRRED